MNYPAKEEASAGLRYFASKVHPGRVTTPQYVALIVREAIVTGVIASGESLRQDRIAAELDISKIPVREALRELEGQGLVNFFPNRGFVVTEVSCEEMIECFKIRRMLETFAVRESVLLASDHDMDQVESIINEFERCADLALSSHWNLSVHLAFYKPARMSHLEQMITRSHTIAQRYTHIYMRLTEAEPETQEEHRQILNAYRQKDVDLAVRLMDDHIAIACAQFAEFLKTVLPSRKDHEPGHVETQG